MERNLETMSLLEEEEEQVEVICKYFLLIFRSLRELNISFFSFDQLIQIVVFMLMYSNVTRLACG
jgi:hypothetical protein